MKSRKIEEAVFKLLMIASITTVLAVLAGILVVIVVRGAPALNLAMLVQTPEGGYYLGKEGGIAN
ncbi:MAG TPA: phosphate ABC transporter permease, partial [Thermodesulfobacteriota bacterium]|nr:phosphate ABC transporter permease [Thermodesulfobacteriota bacterium]